MTKREEVTKVRSLKSIVNHRPRNSKFFDYFLKAHGDVATRAVGEDEIFKNLKALYLDIAFGNLQQEKYLQYLLADARIIQIAIHDCDTKVIQAYIRVESMKFARASSTQFTQLEQFNNTLMEDNTKYFTYSVLKKAFTDFLNLKMMLDAGQPVAPQAFLQVLTAVSVAFNNPLNRESKSVLL